MDETPSLRQRWLAAKMQELRIAAGFESLSTAGEALLRSKASVSRLESGSVVLPIRDYPPILDAYGVTDQKLRETILSVAEEIREERRGWWVHHGDVLTPSYIDLIRLEGTCTLIRTYQAQIIPGLLQTEAYAREVSPATREWADSKELDQFVAVRMARQEAAWGREEPLRFQAVLHEAALRQIVGSQEIHHEQLHHLTELIDRPNIEFKIITREAGAHAGLLGDFTILTLPNPEIDAVLVETAAGDVYVEDSVGVGRYTWAFDRLREVSLSPRQSRDLILELAKGY